MSNLNFDRTKIAENLVSSIITLAGKLDKIPAEKRKVNNLGVTVTEVEAHLVIPADHTFSKKYKDEQQYILIINDAAKTWPIKKLRDLVGLLQEAIPGECPKRIL